MTLAAVMANSDILRLESISAPLLAHLDAREVAVWVLGEFSSAVTPKELAAALRLPWQAVLLEHASSELQSELQETESVEGPLVRKRGFLTVIRTNPAEVALPRRSLPIYLLDGGDPTPAHTLAGQLRRLTMIDSLRRANPRELIVLAADGDEFPSDIRQLWDEGFRPTITLVGVGTKPAADFIPWYQATGGRKAAAVLELDPSSFCSEIEKAYGRALTGSRTLVRIRDSKGEHHALDVTTADDPQYPILGNYHLLQEADLLPLQAADLSANEIEQFFRGSSNSWRPFAAGMPWERAKTAWPELRQLLRRLDRDGVDAAVTAFIRADSGAGGTTLARSLAWLAASEGYPTLVAQPTMLRPAALEVISFQTRVAERAKSELPSDGRLYEAPWLIVFDRSQWEGLKSDVRDFLKALQQSGRPACILAVTGPYVDLDFIGFSSFRELAHLSHEMPTSIAEDFGRHINQYLSHHGPVRSLTEWRNFFEASAVHAEQGISAFWITLSFWLNRQIDLSETLQSWMYRKFNSISDPELRRAVIDIAAMSTERRGLPEALLPATQGWPLSQRLDDLRSEIGALGLLRFRSDEGLVWALAHDLLGRYILSALSYDYAQREALGFGDARSPEHLRFLALRRVSQSAALGWAQHRVLAEDFAVNIFKIDPDRGRATFALYWEEALAALDDMPTILWQTSRTFRHHTAISRRRISNDKVLFPMLSGARVELLERAIGDIRFAIEQIPRSPYDETDLNLYNSLARAYQDLLVEERLEGGREDRIAELRGLAAAATRQAFSLNPDSQFVIETYARSLLTEARVDSTSTAQNAIEVLNLTYSEMERDRSQSRRIDLARLAEEAIQILLDYGALGTLSGADAEVGIIVSAIQALAGDVTSLEALSLSEYPIDNRRRAAELLAHPDVAGNYQAKRLLYALVCLDEPLNFGVQLELLEPLQGGQYPTSAQLRLEYALLLFQRDRHHEGDVLFQRLRPLWKTGEYYVQVPDRLRWLLKFGGTERRQVTARVQSGGEARRFAKVQEMAGVSVVFRAEEFGQSELKPSSTIHAYVSFGHNGPFLRPLTAPHR